LCPCHHVLGNHIPTAHSPAISRFPCNGCTSIFLVSTIRQVICPSPGMTLQHVQWKMRLRQNPNRNSEWWGVLSKLQTQNHDLNLYREIQRNSNFAVIGVQLCSTITGILVLEYFLIALAMKEHTQICKWGRSGR
jgi:polysaccharide pyruvyl transferase WcaK-like protein